MLVLRGRAMHLSCLLTCVLILREGVGVLVLRGWAGLLSYLWKGAPGELAGEGGTVVFQRVHVPLPVDVLL